MSSAVALPHDASLGTLDEYINAVQRIPILGGEEEYALARRFRDQRDRAAAEQLVLSHLRLVVSIARAYLGYGLPLADLIQEGTMGLMRAVKRFDPERGVRLAAFAAHHIRSEIQEFVLKNWRLLRVATTKAQRKLFFNLRRATQRLGWMSKVEMDDVAAALDVRPEDVAEMQGRLCGRDVPLFGAADDDAGEALGYPDVADSRLEPEAAVELEDHRGHLTSRLLEALQSLDERSRDILSQRWLAAEKATLDRLGEKYGISKERVRQIEAKALESLRLELEEAA